ncbi:cyanophycin synthetase [Schlegelella sp. S2-27]|uniref:Cyanophycin synthetase n=1 Tax=Caldimonas mangrovi TaxID=2944811 RepID=A0ABT0YJ86_9BURK|nr:cyanophycin synthetase [Caldimonas mangrovi]MCM5678791.1 cyanophycin synthetase [Caldimonas mangrovi]
MKIIYRRALRGPNRYARKPCVEAVLDLEALDEVASSQSPGFTERLLEWLPSLSTHECSRGHAGGFVERLHEGTYMGHITEHVMLELQSLTGDDVRFGRTRMIDGRPRHYRLVCAYRVEQVALRALDHAVALVEAAAAAARFDVAAVLRELKDLHAQWAPGPSTGAVLDAARRRGIPVLPLGDEPCLYQLGWGSAQRRIQATLTGESRHIAVDIASDKALTKRLLADAGLPVPTGRTVRTLDEAQQAAREIGGIVTLKPLAANQGKGVSTQVSTPQQVASAFARAQAHDEQVLVERTVSGGDHRVLVVGDRVVAAARRRPPSVTGDGCHTVQQLVERLNADPRRGDGHASALTCVRLDESACETLAQQGWALDGVPPAGVDVVLRGNANLSTGGTSEDETDRLHPQTAALCVRAARRIGLDVAGIDLVCEDISVPLAAQGGALIEVNAAPGIRMHEWPSHGTARAAGQAIADSLFAPGETGRIPVVAVTGTNGKTTTTLAIDHVLRSLGRRTGCATTEGVSIGGQTVIEGDCTGYWSAHTVLSDPDVDVAVLETARGGILKRGLCFDRCDVAVVLNVGVDHLGQDDIDSLDALADVKAVVAEAAAKAVVLNAEDAHCVAMTERLDPGVEVVYFSTDPHHLAVARHVKAGGRAVVLRHGAAWLLGRGWAQPIVEVAQLPFTFGGRAPHNVSNALAAIAALAALGLPAADIARPLGGFRCSVQANPLRMNVLRVRGVQVLVDYAHNTPAYEALFDTVDALRPVRVIGVVSAPGDRRDAELREMARLCAQRLDEIFVFELDEDRGRAPGETAAVLSAAALEAAPAKPVHTVPAVREALRRALAGCRPGDLLVYGCAVNVHDVEAAAGEPVEEMLDLPLHEGPRRADDAPAPPEPATMM